MAESTGDPFGVMEYAKQMRDERASQNLLSEIAGLNPTQPDYTQRITESFGKNPMAAASPEVARMLMMQERLAPKVPNYATAFKDPLYRNSYQQRLAKGISPEQAYNETVNEAENEEMAIKLIESGIPADRHGDLMTGGIFDRRKVAQSIADAGKELPRAELAQLLKIAGEYQKAYQDPAQDIYAQSVVDYYKDQGIEKGDITPEQWQSGYYKVRDNRVKTPMEAFQQRLGALEGSYRIPDEVRGLLGGTRPAPVSAPSATPSSAPVVAPPVAPGPGAAIPTNPPISPAATEESGGAPAVVAAPRTVTDKLWQEYDKLFDENDEISQRADMESQITGSLGTSTEKLPKKRAELEAKQLELIKALGYKPDQRGQALFRELHNARMDAGHKSFRSLWE